MTRGVERSYPSGQAKTTGDGLPEFARPPAIPTVRLLSSNPPGVDLRFPPIHGCGK